MKKVIRLTESDLNRIVRRVITETEAKQLADQAKKVKKGENPDMEKSIVGCIKSGSYTHLGILTTGAGATILGSLAGLFVSGVGTIPALILAAAGLVVVGLDAALTLPDSGSKSVGSELNDLYNCLKRNGKI